MKLPVGVIQKVCSSCRGGGGGGGGGVEPSPVYKRLFLLKRHRHLFFHLTFFYEHVSISIVIVYIIL